MKDINVLKHYDIRQKDKFYICLDTNLLGWGVQPITVLHGIVNITSLLVSSTSTIVSAAIASRHSTLNKKRIIKS